MNLNDVFPDGITGEGIFYALNNYDVPWKNSISSLALDLEYYGNVSGGKTISPLLRRLLVNGVITESVALKLANSLYSMNGLRWGKLWDTYNLEYNPIQNYNMTEVMSDDDTVTTYGRTHSKTGTEIDDRTRTDDNKDSVYGFNSNNASDSEESDRTINDDNTHTYNVSDTDTGSDRQSHSYELTRSGNIGVTTSQQMIESERSLWMWRYFYDVVFPDIDKMLTISVYSDDVLPVTMSGGITPTGEISITLNGDYDVTEYASAAVDVPNTYTAADEGKVVNDGALVTQSSQSIAENGTYNTTLISETVVNVPNTYVAADEGKVVNNGALVAQGSQTITENGTYNTTLISELVVNIPGPKLFESASVFRWTFNGPTTGWAVLKRANGAVVGQNYDNADVDVSLVGSLMTVLAHGTTQDVTITANDDIVLSVYRTSRNLGVVTPTEYTMSTGDYQTFTTDALYGGLYVEAVLQ